MSSYMHEDYPHVYRTIGGFSSLLSPKTVHDFVFLCFIFLGLRLGGITGKC